MARAAARPLVWDAAIARALEGVRQDVDVVARLAADPIVVVHEQSAAPDRELAGLVASSLAFGGAATIRDKAREVMARLGGRPSVAADDTRALGRALEGFRHRVFVGDDVARLLAGGRKVQREEGSLGAAFAGALARERALRPALAAFVARIRRAGRFPARGSTERRGPAHILPDPMGGGACKRLLLYLRWMVRPSDGVDLGLWPVSPSVLLCPVDTHIGKIGRNLGFTREKTATWRAAEEITAHLALYCPDDPVRYDFALCHLGMVQRCREKSVDAICGTCPLEGAALCRHRHPRLLRPVVRP